MAANNLPGQVGISEHSPAVTRRDVPVPQAKPVPKKPPVQKGTNGGAGNKPVAPKAPVTPSKPATGMAGLFGGLGPNAYINSLYQPQETALATQQANRQAALHSMVTEFLNSLSSNTASLAPYTNSASQQMSDANNAAAGLAAANPNAVTQNDLAAINAPQAQRSQVAGQNNTAFGGNAALLQYTGGVIPSDQFRDDAAARASYLATLPALGESLGLRGLNSINNMASKENSDLATSKAGDLLKARNDLATYVQGNQKLKAAAAKTAFDQNATATRLGQGQQRIDLTSQMDAFNQKYKINTYNLSVDRLNQSASKFAYQQFKDNRSYTLQLKKYGLQKASAQRAAIAQEYKLHNNGFTPLQINKFKTSAYNIAQNAFTGGGANGPFYRTGPNKGKPITPVGYKVAVREMRSAGVPLSIAVPELNKLYKAGQRGRPLVDNGTTSFDFGGSVGGLSDANPFGSKARLQGPQLSQLAQQALKIAAPEFATPGNVQALIGRIMQESGGNAGAINLWDSNAKAGTPSKGILQTIDSTFNAHKLPGYGDIWNPLDNAIAAIRYMVSRYGRIVGPSSTGY